MLYQTYQAQADAMMPFRMAAQATTEFLQQPWLHAESNPFLRSWSATCELVSRAGLHHERPPFHLDTVIVDGTQVSVSEQRVLETSFCNLLHFRKASSVRQPKILLVAPISGHFATLLRGTAEVLLPDNDVYITDWLNARNIPLSKGRFDLDDYMDLIATFLRQLGPETHVIAVCQPSTPVLATIAMMAEDDDPAQPASMTLMGGPIDPRANPTQVTELAQSRPLDWFKKTMITEVPFQFAGANRRVYPGFLQLASFVGMNLDRHVNAHIALFRNVVHGDEVRAESTRKFYDEYNSVMDLPAEFYLQTIERVFQRCDLANGTFMSRGRKVDPGLIRKTALLTVEGERDDICAPGQTFAAHRFCTGLSESMRAHWLQPKVGHYGVFNGSKFRTEIYPRIQAFIQAHNG